MQRLHVGTLQPRVLVALLSLAVLVTIPSAVSSAHAEALSPWTGSTSYPTADTLSCVTSGGYVYCVSTSGSGEAYYARLGSSGIGAWAVTTAYPTSIQGESCLTSGGYIYCVSGINGTLGPRPTNYVYYAPVSAGGIGAWSRTTNYPVSVIALSCAASGGYAYCVGGYETVGTLQSSVVNYAALSSSGVGPWTSTTSYPITVGQESCVTSPSFIYCVGGDTANGPRPVNNTYSAPVSPSGVGAWTTGPAYPLPDESGDTSLSCSVVIGYTYCVGGDSSSVYYANLPSTGTIGAWTSTSSYPVEVASPSCLVTVSAIMCVGGNTDAVYFTSSPKGQSSHLTITTQNTNGDSLSGYEAVINQSGTTIVATGFTPATFNLTEGQSYTVSVDGFGNCHFDNWLDTGNTTAIRQISIASDAQITAVLDCAVTAISSSQSLSSSSSSSSLTSSSSSTTTNTTQSSSTSTATRSGASSSSSVSASTSSSSTAGSSSLASAPSNASTKTSTPSSPSSIIPLYLVVVAFVAMIIAGTFGVTGRLRKK